MEGGALLPRTFVGSEDGLLRVLQWNVLADQLADNFPRVDRALLQWEGRFALMKAELTRANADLLCLEEVDHYADFESFLLPLGYSGVYRQKEGWHNDGTAIFLRTSKLTLETQHSAVFSGGKRQVYVSLLLRERQTSRQFVVIATHLKSGTRFESHREVEVQQVLHHLEAYSGLPVVLAGDFNSEPDYAVYRLLQAASFSSAYWNTSSPGQEPAFTTLKYRQSLEKYTIDYIWLRQFRSCKYLSLPSESELSSDGLPSAQYPSDHLALVCDVQL